MRPPARATAPRLLSSVAVPAPGEFAFLAWLEGELAEAPGSDVYSDVYADAVASVGRWRRRYRGNQALWRRLLRPERLVKEIVETAPVIAAVRDYVAAEPRRVTIVDLCCGKGYLSMLLAEMLPTDRVRGCVLVDNAWPRHDVAVQDKHINPEHLWGRYADAWPVPLCTSKIDLKKRCSLKALGERWLSAEEGEEDGGVLLLGVHLCGTLSLRAVELFNSHPRCTFLALKPCCLPPPVHARRGDFFEIGRHRFAAADVAAAGGFQAGGVWRGPPRSHLAARFERWTGHLLQGIESGQGGASAVEERRVQVRGGFQNAFIFAERGARTPRLWDGLAARRAGGVTRLRGGALAPSRPTARRAAPPAPWQYSAREARAEATIDGVPAGQLLCWQHVKGVACACGGSRAHLFQGHCGTAIAAALGLGRGCRTGRCRKPHPADALGDLIAHAESASGRRALLGTVAAPSLRADIDKGSRSVQTSRSVQACRHNAARRCSLPPEAALDALRRRQGESSHLAALLAAPWLEEAIADDRVRRLFARDSRSVRKDCSEAWAAAERVRTLLRSLGMPADGEGAALLDVCSGKGMTALVLSFEFPRARVHMLDANGEMELSHVRARPNLDFVQCDLFSRDAAAALAACRADAAACVAVGMHLCGALSPRLLTLAARSPAVDAVVVCPCCLKGSLKERVRAEARRDGREHYAVLVDTLASLARDECGDRGGRVSVEWDGEMLSPRNALVSLCA